MKTIQVFDIYWNTPIYINVDKILYFYDVEKDKDFEKAINEVNLEKQLVDEDFKEQWLNGKESRYKEMYVKLPKKYSKIYIAGEGFIYAKEDVETINSKIKAVDNERRGYI